VFADSRAIRDLYQPIPGPSFQAAVEEASAAVGFTPGPELLDRVCSHPLGIRYVKWRQTVDRLRMLDVPDENVQALRRFVFAQHLLLDVPCGNPLDPAEPFPAQLAEAATLGARGLLAYGRGQFDALREVCGALADWARVQGHRRVVLVENPLGNVVPVAVLGRVLGRVGVDARVISLSPPRDTRVVTYRDAIVAAAQAAAADRAPLVYLDDVLTGSRFSKLADTLRKTTRRHDQPAPVLVALAFRPYHELTDAQAAIRERVRAKVAEERHANDPQAWWDLPELPRVRVDGVLPVAYESPVVWGENELVAGRRRVNLVFNLIEEFRRLHRALVDDDLSARDALRWLWAEEVQGSRYNVPDDVLRGCLAEGLRALDWDVVTAAAEAKFPADFRGRPAAPPDATFAARRVDWLRAQILGVAERGHSARGLAWNALHTLFQAQGRRGGDPRDRQYCYTFYPYNPVLARLHQEVVEGALC
jgi:hypothetical protein